MASRPTHININEDEQSQPLRRPRPPLYMDLPSPRTGEAPPALSPLDAFAMHSRLLQKRFDESAENGRRISRLQHDDVAKELEKRPGYFRSLSSAGSDSAMSDVPELNEDSPTSQKGGLVSRAQDKDRPISHYPVFGNIAKRESARPLSTPNEYFDAEEVREDEQPNSQTRDYFGFSLPRATSPEPVNQKTVNLQPATPLTMPSLTNSTDSIYSTQPMTQQRTLTNGSKSSQRSLAPPKSPAYPKSPRSMHSIRSVPQDSGDDDGSSVNGVSRKFSGSSGMSRPQSPFSPFMHPMNRSPSTMSDYSINGSQRRNFSRPMSSNSNRPAMETRPSFDSRSSFETRPSTDLPLRQFSQPSSDPPSRQASEDDGSTPFATPMENPFFGQSDPHRDNYFDERPTTSYIDRKYTLPRGRNPERSSKDARESWMKRQFEWDNDSSVEPGQPKRSEERDSWGQLIEPPQARAPSPANSDRGIPQERQERVGRERAMSSTNRSRSAEPRTFQKANALHKSTPSVRTHGTDSTDRTIKAVPLHERSPSAELTPEEHLDIGIQTHDDGQLNKSTYHLRLAAKAGLPTGMLLYALACRHGWGMRPNQEEGVMWLRKAIDSSGLEVANVEETLAAATKSTKGDPAAQAIERRKRKAQFALAIYELGISYMNGWGCAKDKPLAVRCYEVAGSWGDCDALAEAGFCYAQGNGVKKDLKKAAALYRKAAEGGMSMAGNSWIYKAKYMDESGKDGSEKEKHDVDASLTSINKDALPAQGRPRRKSIWGRKKEKPVVV